MLLHKTYINLATANILHPRLQSSYINILKKICVTSPLATAIYFTAQYYCPALTSYFPQFRIRYGYREIVKHASCIPLFPHSPGYCLRLAVIQNQSEEIPSHTRTTAMVS